MGKEFTIPKDILETTGLTEKDCLMELAFHLYAKRWVTIGQALRLSQLSGLEFEKELARCGLRLRSDEELNDDVATLKERGRL